MKRLLYAILLPWIALLLSSCVKTGSGTRNSVIIIGSSIASGEGASSYEKSWAGKLSDNNKVDQFQNLSIWSSTTYHFLPLSYTDFCKSINRPTPDPRSSVSTVIAKHPDFVILSITTNDIMSGYAPSEYLRNIQIITDSLEKARVRYLVTSNTIAGSFTVRQKQDAKSVLLALPVIYGRAYIDIMTPLVDTSKMEIRKNLFVSDYTHPNDDGHLSLFTRIDSAYKKLTN